jgi:excisionase family DNA binding protein
MRVEEVAKALGCGRSTIYDAAKRGEIPTITIGRRLLVPTASLRAMLGLDAERDGSADCSALHVPDNDPVRPATTGSDRGG